MGMFDSVRVPCPKCGTIHLAQSKGGSCILAEYNLHDAPSNTLLDVNRHPMKCEKCGFSFRVELTVIPSVVAS